MLLANAAKTNTYPCENSNFNSYLAVCTGKVTQNKSQLIWNLKLKVLEENGRENSCSNISTSLKTREMFCPSNPVSTRWCFWVAPLTTETIYPNAFLSFWSSCKWTKSCNVLASSIPANGPRSRWLFGVNLFFKLCTKRERTSGGWWKKPMVCHILSNANDWLPPPPFSLHRALRQLLPLCVSMSFFNLARQGSFSEIRSLPPL